MSDPDDRSDGPDVRRARARRTALAIAAIAVAIYLGFIFFGGAVLK